MEHACHVRPPEKASLLSIQAHASSTLLTFSVPRPEGTPGMPSNMLQHLTGAHSRALPISFPYNSGMASGSFPPAECFDLGAGATHRRSGGACQAERIPKCHPGTAERGAVPRAHDHEEKHGQGAQGGPLKHSPLYQGVGLSMTERVCLHLLWSALMAESFLWLHKDLCVHIGSVIRACRKKRRKKVHRQRHVYNKNPQTAVQPSLGINFTSKKKR
eukprot:1159445-Pelagomonas_calceolata.AAC.3